MAEWLKEVKPSRRIRVSGAQGKLHDDGAVFHPGKRNTVIKLADVAERSGCEKGRMWPLEKSGEFSLGRIC